MRQIAENFGTARAMLLALGVTMGLAGCQPTAQGSEAAPKDPPAKTLAHVLQSRPPADDAQGCFTQLKGPAKVETVTGQVQVIPEQRDPKTGKVLAWVDLTGILGKYRVESSLEDVLNGIAYDADTGNIYVTGKRWPYLFHIQVK